MSWLYRSQRVGKNGELFYLYKIRTMTTDGGVPTAGKNDPRLTRLGKWLRRFKLDELPTIWNILKGNVTLCGCRPDTPEEIASLDKWTRDMVLSQKPGIISPATLWNYQEDETVAGKNDPHAYYTEVIKPIKYKLNVWYVQNRSFWLDLRIILAYFFRYLGVPPSWFNIYPPYFNERIG